MEQPSPRVSVVIPTFGRPELVTRAVDGVLAQTMSDLELLVVVDGDDPATTAALAARPDPRLRVIVNETKRGAGRTRDVGAKAGRGQWVAFLDDDDEWLPTKLERQLAAAPADGRAVVTTLSHVVSPTGRFVRPTHPFEPGQQVDEWLFDRRSWAKGGMSFLQTSSLMFPRVLFDTIGFEDTNQHEDWELVIRAVKTLGYALVTVPEPLTVHYWGEARPSLSQERSYAGSVAWLDKMGPLISPRAYSGFVLNGIGQHSANIGEYQAVLPLLRLAFRKGRPTGPQLFRFAMCWAMPLPLRNRIRHALQGAKA